MSAATRSLPDHQRMKAIDIYNLSDAFEALDEENRTGRLDYAQIQTLYLGLGYNDCGRRRMTVQDLQADAQALGLPATDLSLPEVLQLFESVGQAEWLYSSFSTSNGPPHLCTLHIFVATPTVYTRAKASLATHLRRTKSTW